MKKSIIYETPDGQKFTTRRQALQHETNLTRRAQITRFLLARTKLKQVRETLAHCAEDLARGGVLSDDEVERSVVASFSSLVRRLVC